MVKGRQMGFLTVFEDDAVVGLAGAQVVERGVHLISGVSPD
jgi:hypothetical protein